MSTSEGDRDRERSQSALARDGSGASGELPSGGSSKTSLSSLGRSLLGKLSGRKGRGVSTSGGASAPGTLNSPVGAGTSPIPSPGGSSTPGTPASPMGSTGKPKIVEESKEPSMTPPSPPLGTGSMISLPEGSVSLSASTMHHPLAAVSMEDAIYTSKKIKSKPKTLKTDSGSSSISKVEIENTPFSIEKKLEEVTLIGIGSEVMYDYAICPGVIRWIGQISGREFAGIELREKVGSCDGRYGEDQLFECKDGFGVFIPLADLYLAPSIWKEMDSKYFEDIMAVSPAHTMKTVTGHSPPSTSDAMGASFESGKTISFVESIKVDGTKPDLSRGPSTAKTSDASGGSGDDEPSREGSKSSSHAPAFGGRVRSATVNLRKKKHDTTGGPVTIGPSAGVSLLSSAVASSGASVSGQSMTRTGSARGLDYLEKTMSIPADEQFYKDRVINSELMPSLTEIFSKMDINNDGLISRTELAGYFSGLRLDPKAVEGFLKVLSMDSEEFLNYDKFCRVISFILFEKFKHIKRKWPKDYTLEVFLGGACGDTTWRKSTAIPLLVEAGVTFYNPQVEEWRPDMVVVEAIVKERCAVLLFVVGSETRGIASMIEATQYICEGREVVLVLEDISEGKIISGDKITKLESKDLNRGRAYLADVAQRWSIPTFANVRDATLYIIEVIMRGRDALGSTAEVDSSELPRSTDAAPSS